MRSKYTKWVVVAIVLAVLGVLSLGYMNSQKVKPPAESVVVLQEFPIKKIIGKSVNSRNIEAFTYLTRGTNVSSSSSMLSNTNLELNYVENNTKRILFVGGIHGGYEWNSVLLSYMFMDYLEQNPSIIPANMAVTIIPSINPDGVFKVTGKEGRFDIADVSTSSSVLASGRFDANNVDLNRNFDCKWKDKSTWQSKVVSAGTAPFSEPEALALRDFVSSYKPDVVVFWHSQSNAVYASQCERGILPVTVDIMNIYSKASGYPAIKVFGAYATTGAADDWLASIGVPAITVELKTHESVEWDRNLAGIKSIINYIEKKTI